MQPMVCIGRKLSKDGGWPYYSPCDESLRSTEVVIHWLGMSQGVLTYIPAITPCRRGAIVSGSSSRDVRLGVASRLIY